jgi:hypothetical protein
LDENFGEGKTVYILGGGYAFWIFAPDFLAFCLPACLPAVY